MTKVQLASISGVGLQKAVISQDERGSFTKYFEHKSKKDTDSASPLHALAVADNLKSGTIRGLHFQTPPFEEEKVIFCLSGKIFDVVVDLRTGSSTQGMWGSVELQGDEPSILTLPKGVAHGYQTLSPNSKVFYAIGSSYNPDHAFALNYADPDLLISWPLPITQISTRDTRGISLSEAIELLKVGSK